VSLAESAVMGFLIGTVLGAVVWYAVELWRSRR
jgi:hypothetical protein